MADLFSKSLSELETIVTELGAQKFRAKQIREYLDRGCPEILLMKTIPQDIKDILSKSFWSLPIKDQSKLISSDNETIKFLFRLADDEVIETVLMKTSYGNSVCVSSQAGCAMGCKFCASTLLGLKRNLTSAEMYAQVLRAQWELRQTSGTRPNGDANQNDISHIVVMGTGEPLQNQENTIEFLRRANKDLGIGWRKMTLSTCGIVPEIKKLMNFGEPINLAISMHAPNDELRRQIMPIANQYTIKETLDAAFGFSGLHNRQLMIEYILLGNFNDAPEHAEELAKLLKGKLCMVNLIPWNPVTECAWTKPSNNQVHRFQDILIKNGIHARIRKERGSDIASACGQLRLGKNKSVL